MALNKSLLILFFVVFTELIGFGLIIPVLPQLALQYHTNHFTLGLLMASFSLAQFIASPILGYLSDIYGRKPLLILSKLGTVLAYILMAYAQSYWMFLFARLLDGFTGGNIAVARAYIADITTEETRSKGMAVIGISFGLGFIVGPALGGFLFHGPHGQMITAFVAASLSLIAALITWLYLEESHTRKKIASSHDRLKGLFQLKNKAVLVIFVSFFLYMISFSGFETTFSLFTNTFFDFSLRQNSFFFMYAGLVGLVVQGCITRYSFRQFKLLCALGLGLLSLGFFGLASAGTVTELMLFVALISVGVSLVNTFMPSLLSMVTTTDNNGVVMGAYESIGSISRVIGPLIAYSVSFQLLRQEYFAFSLLVAIVAIFLYATLTQRLLQSGIVVKSSASSESV
jgi:DHA1 family tetracycline resistance protein-like MFS transporter